MGHPAEVSQVPPQPDLAESPALSTRAAVAQCAPAGCTVPAPSLARGLPHRRQVGLFPDLAAHCAWAGQRTGLPTLNEQENRTKSAGHPPCFSNSKWVRQVQDAAKKEATLPVSWRSSTLAPPERSLDHHQRPRTSTEERNLGRRGTCQSTSTQSTSSVASLLRDFLGSPRSSFSGRALTGHRAPALPIRQSPVCCRDGDRQARRLRKAAVVAPKTASLSNSSNRGALLRGSALKQSWKFPRVKLRPRSRKPIGIHL